MKEKDLLYKITVGVNTATEIIVQYSLFNQNNIIGYNGSIHRFCGTCSPKISRISMFRNQAFSMIENFQNHYLPLDSREISNINDKNSILKLTKYLKTSYNVFGGLYYINFYFQGKYMALRAIQNIPILISRRYNMNWVIERKHLIKYKEFIQKIMSCNDTNYNFL